MVGCGHAGADRNSASVANRLKDVYNEVCEFEHKRGHSPVTEEEFKEFLTNRHPNLGEWLSDISFTNTFGLTDLNPPRFISRKKYARIEKDLGGRVDNLILDLLAQQCDK
jgi:hypothetical protein